MKKNTLTYMVVFSLVLVLLLGMNFGSTGAWFKDTGTSQDNIITAGTLNLTLDGSDSATVPAKMVGDKFVPGDYKGLGAVNITNTGNLPGRLSVSLLNIRNHGGDLGPMLSIIVKRNFPDYDSFQYMTGLVDGATLSVSTLTAHPEQIIQPGETLQFQLNAQWTPTDHDNLAQGDSVDFDLCFTLDQIR